jgi:hypothetical protein
MYQYYKYAFNIWLSRAQDKMIVNSELERTYKEATMTYLKADNEGSFEKPQGRSLVSELRIYSDMWQEC